MEKRKSGGKIIYFVIIFIACMFLFFTNDFGLVDIRKTAIITAVGIDKEDDGYKVSALVAVPGGSGEQKSTSEAVIGGSGGTVSFALSEIADKTGWVPKLVFCRSIIIGEEVANEGVMTVLDYFVRNEYMNDSCMVACAKGTAEEILSAAPSTEALVSVALSSVLGGEANQSGKAAVINLKDFAVGYYGEAASGYMPVIEAVSSGKETSSESTGGGSGEGSEGEKEKSSGGGNIYRTTTTAMFVKGKKAEELTAEETFMYNVLRTKLRYAVFNVEADGKTYSLGLSRNSGDIRLKVEGTAPKLEVNVKAFAAVADTDFSDSVEGISRSVVLPVGVKEAAEERMKEILGGIFSKCKSSGCDLFLVADKLKKFENKYYEAYKNDVLKLCVPSFGAEIVSAKKF